jgi:hypothetical protein
MVSALWCILRSSSGVDHKASSNRRINSLAPEVIEYSDYQAVLEDRDKFEGRVNQLLKPIHDAEDK